MQMTNVKQGDRGGWGVIKEGIYMTFTECRVRKKPGGLAKPKTNHSRSFLYWSRLLLLAKTATQIELGQAKSGFTGSQN